MNLSGGWGHWSFKSLINDPNGFCWGAAPMPWGSPDAKHPRGDLTPTRGRSPTA